jgi:hypothetical protein
VADCWSLLPLVQPHQTPGWGEISRWSIGLVWLRIWITAACELTWRRHSERWMTLCGRCRWVADVCLCSVCVCSLWLSYETWCSSVCMSHLSLLNVLLRAFASGLSTFASVCILRIFCLLFVIFAFACTSFYCCVHHCRSYYCFASLQSLLSHHCRAIASAVAPSHRLLAPSPHLLYVSNAIVFSKRWVFKLAGPGVLLGVDRARALQSLMEHMR